MKNISPLTQERAKYTPKLPRVFEENALNICATGDEKTTAVADAQAIRGLFPHLYGAPVLSFKKKQQDALPPRNVGVILSGGQAPGGHNVIAGILDGITAANPRSTLYGFLGGPSGVISGDVKKLTASYVKPYRNTGGFDIIGSGRTKLETEEQFQKTLETLNKLDITALVIIGGDDSNTNAALLAEYFAAQDTGIQVIGVPKTIDGDLKNEHIEISFGFDTACKTYSEITGNICRDANSARKYWHFIKIMGRSASHIALETALQTQPNMTLISEEVEQKKMRLKDVVTMLADGIAARAKDGKDFGVLLVPEGLIEFIPEMKTLIHELNEILAQNATSYAELSSPEKQITFVTAHLSKASAQVFSLLPTSIQHQLLMDRDPHGNVQVSRIETEKLLIELVTEELAKRKENGAYTGKFSAQNHFFGYEGRCAAPSNFDADYCYSLGYTAAALVYAGATGYMACVRNLAKPAKTWKPGGIPLTMMMNMERRHGADKPVIKKALVTLNGAPFSAFAKSRKEWCENECYLNAGPIQYFGPSTVCDAPTRTLELESSTTT